MSTITPPPEGISFVPYVPGPPLSRHVVMLWYVHGHVPYVRERILPTEHVELIVNFGAPHRTYHGVDSHRFDVTPDAWICGIQTGVIVNQPTGVSHMLGVRFRPGGVFPFLGLPLSELRDHLVTLEAVWGREAVFLRERLAAAPSIPTRFRMLERALKARLDESAQWRPLAYVVQHLVDPTTPLSIRDLSDQVGVSQKQLIARCKQHVGVTPKRLARIARFHRALQSIGPAGSPNWADIALRCGYFDQSHFNRDFLAFSGLTPGAYLAQRNALFDTPPAQGESVKFVPDR